ncbi:MAG TPA: serine/threonine-protein kinase [Polyangia bacterium]|nr:serine/threonine-protein kinase [Polyangia bacterium]
MEASPPEPPDPPDPRLGSVLQGRYRLNAKLASGAMGVVYRGERLQLGRAVAVKFLHPWIATQKAFISRFENEARAMSRLQHPNCVSVIDFGVDGTPYLVMEFVTGQTVRQALEGGRLPPTRALHVVRQLLAGLGHAHAQGIVHRDLKPENLILSDEAGLGDHLRILDFGLAKLRDGPAMTAGLAVGTPSYMSPEQTGADGAIDARTDFYAVGVLLFELLAGRKPFVSENVGELLLMQREKMPPLLREAAPDAGLSAELEAVVSKALSKFADDRYQSARDFVAALDATPEGRGIARTPPAPAAKKTLAGPVAASRAVARPVPTADATIVDSPSRIQRLVGGDAAAPEAAAAPVAPANKNRRLVWVGVGLGGVAVAALLVGRAVRNDHGVHVAPATREVAVANTSHAKKDTQPVPAVAPPSSADIEARLADARKLLAGGDWDKARAALESLRADAPDDADAAYLLATIDLEHHRYVEGLSAAQAAVRKNATLKSDPDLVRDEIQALASDQAYERAEAQLRGAGAAATPFLKEAARRDPNPRVRDRAAAMLGGEKRSAWGRSSHASSSVFHR